MSLQDTLLSYKAAAPQENDDYLLRERETYGQASWGAQFIKHLATVALDKFGNLAILELGAGPCLTVSNLLAGIPSRTNVAYHSIDKHAYVPVLPPTVARTHHQGCAFQDDTYANVPTDFFNVLIVDIEPHGREVELVKKCHTFLKHEFIVIFKCIGSMDIWGSALGSYALTYMKEHYKLIDIVHCDSWMFRDVIAVCSKREV